MHADVPPPQGIPLWRHVYGGIAKGLGNLDVQDFYLVCVDDALANHTVETFRAAFRAFEIKKIYEGTDVCVFLLLCVIV